MTLPRGTSSGRGREYQGKALPARPGVEPSPPRPRSSLQRKGELRRVSERREAERPKATSTLKAGKSKRVRPGGHEAAQAWRDQAFQEVIATYGFLLDEVNGEHLSAADAQVHHVIEAGDQWTSGVALDVLPTAAGADAVLVWHPDLTMVLHRDTHARHHNRDQTIPRSAIRDVTWDLADELDRRADDGWWRARLEQDHSEDV